MNIQRVQTGSLNTKAAEQIQRGVREVEKPQVEKTEATPIDASPAATLPTAAKQLHPRLAAYADKIDARLSLALESRDLSPRQKSALEAAKAHFHSMVQQLDDAYSSNPSQKVSMSDALHGVMDDLVQSVHHIQGGGTSGTLDIQG